MSDAQYTAKNAWAQTLMTSATLSIPSGERLTITQADEASGGGFVTCTLNASLNGTNVTYDFSSAQDAGSGLSTFQPIYADSGTVVCWGT